MVDGVECLGEIHSNEDGALHRPRCCGSLQGRFFAIEPVRDVCRDLLQSRGCTFAVLVRGGSEGLVERDEYYGF